MLKNTIYYNVIRKLYNEGDIERKVDLFVNPTYTFTTEQNVKISSFQIIISCLYNDHKYVSEMKVYEKDGQITYISIMNDALEGYVDYDDIPSLTGYVCDDFTNKIPIMGAVDYLVNVCYQLQHKTSRWGKFKNVVKSAFGMY